MFSIAGRRSSSSSFERTGAGRAVRIVAVVLGELFPVDLVDVRRLLDLGGLLGLILLGGLETVDRRGFVLPVGDLVLEVLFEDGVLDHLLIDERLELGARHLQDLDRLTQLRRHDELLRQSLLQDDARVVRHVDQ
jgi:hypothetical protein